MADRLETIVNKFDGKNYNQWKFQIKCALIAKGVYDITTGKVTKPGQDKPKDLESWIKSDGYAMYLLTSAMDISQISLVENCSSSKEIMDKLDSIYLQKSETTKMMVHEKFHQYKMDMKDSIAQHISKVENLARDIKNTGETISDSAIMTKILSGLPSKYRGFRQAWLSMDEAKQNLNNLTARLLDEESNLCATEEAEVALTASSYHKKPQQNITKNRSQNRGYGNKDQRDFKRNIICYKCRGKGHYARECRSNKGNSERPPKAESSAFNIHDGNIKLYPAEDIWIMDSGASSHMTYRREYLSSFEIINDGSSVIMGNNQVLTVEGKGTVYIKKLVEGHWCDGRIENVLFIPKLKRNLFSEGIITKKGMKVVKQGDTARIYKDGELTACAIRDENNLYRMSFQTLLAETNTVVASSLKEWHERLGHINIKTIKELITKKLVPDISLSDSNEFFCEACIFGKQHKLPFKSNVRHQSEAGERILSDLCGPMEEPSVGGARYFILFKDECSSYRTVYFLKHKSDAIERFKEYYNLVKNKYGHKIKYLHTDNGKEYCNAEFKELLSKLGIELENTAPYTPEQNGRCERDNRTIVESMRSMLHAKSLPKYLWAEAVSTAVYLLNRTTNSQVTNTTPFELWTSKKPTLSHTKTFGSTAYTFIPDVKRQKLDAKSKKLIFVGYQDNSNNYRLFDPVTKKIQVSRNVIFEDDNTQNKQETNIKDASKDNSVNIEFSVENEIKAALEGSTITDSEFNKVSDNEQFVEEISDNNAYKLRPRANLKLPKRYEVNIAELGTPISYEDAVSSPDHKQWEKAIQEELEALEKNNVWTLTKLPQDKNVIDSKWVFKIKRNQDGNISRYKARLCARGFNQKEGIDYNETYSPTVRYDSIRVIISLAAKYKLKIKQFDIKTAFLYGKLEEDIYLIPPEGINVPDDVVCKLNKSLYGLKQSSRNWNLTFNNFIKSFGFIQNRADSCVYKCKYKDTFTLLLIYVDDGLILSDSEEIMDEILHYLKGTFEITIHKPSCFVGIEIIHEEDGSIFIHQSNYIKRMVKRFNLENAKPNSTPADPHTNLTLNTESESLTGKVPYREAVGCLMFTAVVSRPDIMYAVGIVSRFLAEHSSLHWNGVKRILRYLNNTHDYGIHYKSADNQSLLVGYSDADYANDTITRRSTSGYLFKTNNSIVTWCSQRQPTVSLSTTEAEYISLSDSVKEVLWLQRLLNDICDIIVSSTVIFVDNQSAIKLCHNSEFHKRTKHIDIKYHFIREKLQEGLIDVSFISTKHQLADILTKALSKQTFEYLRNEIGMIKMK